MANITPNHSTSVVLANTTIAPGAGAYATLDLRGKYGANVIINMGRLSSSNLSGTPFQVIIRPTYGNKAVRCPADMYGRMAISTTACTVTTLTSSMTAGTDYSATLSSASGFAGDMLVAINPGNSDFEVLRISKVSGSTVYFDSTCAQSHSSGAGIVTLGESWSIDLPGGNLYEFCFDYALASGPSICVSAHAMIHDYDTIA